VKWKRRSPQERGCGRFPVNSSSSSRRILCVHRGNIEGNRNGWMSYQTGLQDIIDEVIAREETIQAPCASACEVKANLFLGIGMLWRPYIYIHNIYFLPFSMTMSKELFIRDSIRRTSITRTDPKQVLPHAIRGTTMELTPPDT